MKEEKNKPLLISDKWSTVKLTKCSDGDVELEMEDDEFFMTHTINKKQIGFLIEWLSYEK